MKKKLPHKENFPGNPIDISDDDILEAMKKMEGYVDITTGDFKEVYRFAYQHAIDRLMNFTKAKEIMTKNVVFVKKDTPLLEIVEIMADHEISGVPVVDEEDKVIGVISEKDFLSRIGAQSSMGIIVQLLQKRGDIPQPMLWQKAENIMNSPALTVNEDISISEITNIFKEKNINRVPVINDKGKLVGIISRADALQSPFFKAGNKK
ncbi:MAG: CBS domain-containing protein [Nitrospirae bacterium]|nr:CBS domain-containing protein [Nitrospirota bacterium]